MIQSESCMTKSRYRINKVYVNFVGFSRRQFESWNTKIMLIGMTISLCVKFMLFFINVYLYFMQLKKKKKHGYFLKVLFMTAERKARENFQMTTYLSQRRKAHTAISYFQRENC